MKGGVMKYDLWGVDVWFDGDCFEILKIVIVEIINIYGIGCIFLVVIIVNLVWG